LQPELSDGDSPESFKVASSLGSSPSYASTDVEQGTGVIRLGEKVSVVSGMDLRTAKVMMAVPVRASKYGSPVQRKPISAKEM
jgi:hypothetical protein